jgi:hypothetical protein
MTRIPTSKQYIVQQPTNNFVIPLVLLVEKTNKITTSTTTITTTMTTTAAQQRDGQENSHGDKQHHKTINQKVIAMLDRQTRVRYSKGKHSHCLLLIVML